MAVNKLSNRAEAVYSSIATIVKQCLRFKTFNWILATDAAASIDRYSSTFESTPTIYDKAMDAGRHIMNEYGPDHRLFDNSHSPLGGGVVKDAVKDDTIRQEITLFSTHIGKIVTPMGIDLYINRHQSIAVIRNHQQIA